MNTSNLKYKTKTATEEEIYLHLKLCNEKFIPPLEEKVNIREYSKKLFKKSVTFEAWENQTLAGLVAAYFNDTENHLGFITNVSILKDYKGKGIASELMNMCINYSKGNKFTEIILEVSKENKDAISLYEKFNFVNFEIKNDLLIMKLKIKK